MLELYKIFRVDLQWQTHICNRWGILIDVLMPGKGWRVVTKI